jgi:hypothetical protein
MKPRKFLFASLVLLAALLVQSLDVPPVQAQEGTEVPTLTPTPNYQIGVPLTDGTTLIIERRISFGDIAVVIVGLALLLMFILYLFIRVPKLWH